MNFKDALQYKSQFAQDPIIKDGMTLSILVTPASEEDLIKFMEDYRSIDFTDDTAKAYSLNGQFKVYGLWTDGVHVVHKEL